MTVISLGGNMKTRITSLKQMFLALFFLSGIFALIQINAFIPILIFAGLSYGAIHMIEAAIEHDLKYKKNPK
jgi:hypothetical protein